MKPLYEEEARKRQQATQLAGRDENGNYKTSVESHGAEPNIKGTTNEIVGKKLGVSAGTVKRESYSWR